MTVSTYVIALEQSKRYVDLEIDLKKELITFSRISAIDGKSISSTEISNQVDSKSCISRLGAELTASQIGCALSHKQAYEQFIEAGSHWALILEEDVRLESDFSRKLELLLMAVEIDEPCVIELFSRGERFVNDKNILQLDLDHRVYEFSSIPGQTAAYLINREAAKLGVSSSKVDGPADWPNWAAKVKFLCIYPFLASEKSEGSSIDMKLVTQWKYRLRVLQIFTGIHYVRYRGSFSSRIDYFTLIVKPLLNRFKWELSGRPTFPKSEQSGLWLV